MPCHTILSINREGKLPLLLYMYICKPRTITINLFVKLVTLYFVHEFSLFWHRNRVYMYMTLAREMEKALILFYLFYFILFVVFHASGYFFTHHRRQYIYGVLHNFVVISYYTHTCSI